MQNAVQADVYLQNLALVIARNKVGADLPLKDILKSEALTELEYEAISANPTYQTYLQHFVTELTESGFSFEAKCRVLAEDMLPQYYHLGKDQETPAAVRSKVMENIVNWAKLDPQKDGSAVPGSGFSINIVLPDGQNGSSTTTVTIDPAFETPTNSEQDDALEAEFSDETPKSPEKEAPKQLTSMNDWIMDFFESDDVEEYPIDDGQ